MIWSRDKLSANKDLKITSVVTYMASFSNSCGVCDLRHTNKPSIVWCTECDEGLCKECQEHHSLSKGTKNHKTLAITEYMNLPDDQIGEDISSKDYILNSLVQDENLKNHSLEFKINTALQNIISDIKNFGDIHFEARPCDIVLSRKKNKQAQIMVPVVPSRSIESIKLNKIKTIQIEGDINFGCCMLPDGRMVFTYCQELAVIVFSNKGLKDFEVKMPCSVFDIVYISVDNTLAVTSGGSIEQCIIIIDLEKKEIKKTISLNSNIYGIALKDNQLIYSSEEKGIRLINLNDESIIGIVRDTMPQYCYIAALGNKIYHTNCFSDTVTCYNQQGISQWTFLNKSILRSPCGIDVDIDGNVYVAGVNSKNVVVISRMDNAIEKYLVQMMV
ncbi:unnamed protein product [Mytilus edulis]|uniref:B box-type domain-containing protein n=1 Tax=Mytilus edulis TaxID=6550 RepID=A0A8S3SET7_MYTED|nr:unnamed protein product [Mytilus edulis]